MAEITLLELYNKHKKGDWPDKGSTHSYLEIYDQILAPYRETAKNVLEIGLMSGESLRMWADYFDGTVYGMDCDIKPVGGIADLSQAIEEGYNIRIGDACNPQDVEKYFSGLRFDVIIEDAGHEINQQLKIKDTLWPYLADGGIYIIEDVQDIDATKSLFVDGQIIDRRKVKGRYDDVIVIFRK